MNLSRRSFVGAAGASLVTALSSRPSHAADKLIRIGFQKYGTLILLKAIDVASVVRRTGA